MKWGNRHKHSEIIKLIQVFKATMVDIRNTDTYLTKQIHQIKCKNSNEISNCVKKHIPMDQNQKIQATRSSCGKLRAEEIPLLTRWVQIQSSYAKRLALHMRLSQRAAETAHKSVLVYFTFPPECSAKEENLPVTESRSMAMHN